MRLLLQDIQAHHNQFYLLRISMSHQFHYKFPNFPQKANEVLTDPVVLLINVKVLEKSISQELQITSVVCRNKFKIFEVQEVFWRKTCEYILLENTKKASKRKVIVDFVSKVWFHIDLF
jgi:hypothetical protein